MRPDRMTTKSREAFQDALDRASRFGNPELSPEHLLAAMLEQEGGVAGPLLQKAGADVGRAARSARAQGPGPPAGDGRCGARTLAPNARSDPPGRRRGQTTQRRIRVRRALPPGDGEARSRDGFAAPAERRRWAGKASVGTRERPWHATDHGPGSRREVPSAGEVLP